MNVATTNISVTVRYGLGNEVRRTVPRNSLVRDVISEGVQDILGIPQNFTVTAAQRAMMADTALLEDTVLEVAAQACSKA